MGAGQLQMQGAGAVSRRTWIDLIQIRSELQRHLSSALVHVPPINPSMAPAVFRYLAEMNELLDFLRTHEEAFRR